MLTATKANVWSYDHNIGMDGRPLCVWRWQLNVGTGTFDLDGRRWTVESARRVGPFHLVDDQRWIVAILVAEDRGTGYVLHADGRVHRFEHRQRLFRRECLLSEDGRVLGHVTRRATSTEAHLPMFSPPVQVLLLGVLCARWDAESQSSI